MQCVWCIQQQWYDSEYLAVNACYSKPTLNLIVCNQIKVIGNAEFA